MRLHARFLVLPVFLLSGCGLVNTSSITGTNAAGNAVPMGGSVHGGNQPVTGATVQLWQVGKLGYGSAPAALGTSVTTGAGGTFSLAGAFTCPSGSTLVYATATGGNPGLTAGTNNSALVMMTVLGPCSSITSSTFITINEVSTVASVYALAQFMNTSGGIGSYGNSNIGLSNAFATVNNLVNTTAGTARTSPASGNANVFPSSTLNTLANILTPCVNSTGSSSSSCVALFSAAKPSGGTAPGNTLTAALDIALNPGQNQTPLYNQSLPNAAFQPALSAAPNDWTLSLGFAQGANPNALALDTNGNIWTVAYGSGSGSLAEMSALGVPASNSPYNNSFFNGSWALTIDTSNNVWVTNKGGNSLMELNLGNGAIQGINGLYNSIGLSSPEGVMLDGNGNLWIANNGNSTVTEFTPNTTSTTQYNAGGLSAPVSIASDQNGQTWVTDGSGGSITSIPQYSGGSNAGYAAHTGGGLSTPSGLAIDSSGNIWVTDSSLGEVAELNNSGSVVSPNGTGDSGGGITSSYANAIDGAGNVWIADFSGNRLSELNASAAVVSPSNGYQGGLGAPKALAIDASGNIWVGNSEPLSGATITEFIGLAAPSNMPLQQGIETSQIGERPGTLTIYNSFLSNTEVGISYSNTFMASGGSGNYAWSITSGLSALQGDGFSFTSGGVLSGTPNNTGSFTFTVQVQDTTTLLTATATDTLTVSTPPPTVCTHDGTGNALLHGNYAFLLSGFNPSGHNFDEIGAFKADGSGNITAGDADVNGDQNISAFASGEQQYNFTGTYSVGSTDNRGIFNFTNSNSSGTAGLPAATAFCFAADTVTDGVAYSGRMIQSDGSGFLLTGFFLIQNPTYFTNSAIATGYAFGLQGVTGTTPNRRGMIGQFTANGSGGISSGQIDTSGVNYNSGNSTYVNNYSAANAVSSSGSSYSLASNGRGTITFNVGGNSLPFVFYTTGVGGQLLILSQNASTSGTTPLLVGKALEQTTTSFTTASVKAAGVFRADATSDPNYPPFSDKDTVGQITFDGAGNLTYLADQNSGGVIGTPATNSATANYTVSSLGYVTLSNSGSNAPDFYLYAPGGGFGLDNSTGVTSYYMLPQTIPSGGFTNSNLSSNLSGGYAIGTVFPLVYNISEGLPEIFSGQATFSSGAFGFTQDVVAAPGTPASAYIEDDQMATGTYTLDPTYGPASGRFLIQQDGTTIVAGYIISPLSAFALTVQTNNDPQLVEADHQ